MCPDRELARFITTSALTVDQQMSDREFRLFQTLIHERSGIRLENGKKAFLVRRLSRLLKHYGLTSFTDLYRRVCDDSGVEESTILTEAVTTNETSFFRDPRQFEYIEEELLPALEDESRVSRRPRHLRVWSASCATGEEAYSLAMLFTQQLPSNWLIRILATDIDGAVLSLAREGLYDLKKLSQIPDVYHKQCLLRGTGRNEGLFCVAPEVRMLVDFKQINLVEEPLPVAGNFDMIFCRNTLMYFDEPTRARVVDNLVQHTAPEGLLFLGQAESLAGQHQELDPLPAATFRRRRLNIFTPPGDQPKTE